MQQLKFLILTDHTHHSGKTPLYTLAKALFHHPRCAQMDVATRGNNLNDYFFKGIMSNSIHASEVREHFTYSPDGATFKKNVRRVSLKSYDVIWLNIPSPVSKDFLLFLKKEFPNVLIINAPEGILKAGSMTFLMNFPQLCPSMKICRSLSDIKSMEQQFPIILMPIETHRHQPVIKITPKQVQIGDRTISFDEFCQQNMLEDRVYLGIKLLKDESKSAKRITVINGQIMGVMPFSSSNSPLKKVKKNGYNGVKVNEEDIKIVNTINAKLIELGVVMYSIDTLLNEQGQQILSKINIDNINDLIKVKDKSVWKETSALIWAYIAEKTLNN